MLGPEEFRAYPLDLATGKQLVPARLIIAVAAWRFLDTVTLRKAWAVETVTPTPKGPDTLPVVLSPAEVAQFLACVHALTPRTILTAC